MDENWLHEKSRKYPEQSIHIAEPKRHRNRTLRIYRRIFCLSLRNRSKIFAMKNAFYAFYVGALPGTFINSGIEKS